MILGAVLDTISTIVGIACGAWLFGLAIFVIVKSIINKVRAKRQIQEDSKDITDHDE